MPSLSLRMGRFAGVGTLATLVHVSAAFLANQSGAAGPMTANTFGLVCAVAVTYLGNYYWTFPGGGSHLPTLQRFCVMAGATLLWTSSVVHVVGDVLGWPFIAALLVILATAPPANFAVSQLWVFRPDRTGLAWSDLELPALLALLAGAAWFYAGTMLNHDTSWYLIATSRWLDGAELYRDIVEINPPLAFYLTAPAVLLARATGLAPHHAYVLQVAALSLPSLLWLRSLLRRAPLDDAQRRIMLAAGVVALCLAPIVEFGQRDHLMMIFVLPYIALMAFAPASGRAERGLIGAFALLGLALKPHFFALPLFMGLLLMQRRRTLLAPFTPEHLVIGVGAIVYAAAVWAFHPAWFTDIVPMGRLVYDAYGASPIAVLMVPGLVAALALASLVAKMPEGSERSIAVTLAVVTAALAVAYIAQFKGWDYHRIPLYGALSLWWAWMAAPLLHARTLRAASSLTISISLAAITLPLLAGPYHNAAVEKFAPYLRDADSFMALSAHVPATYPLANLTATEPTSRYSGLWLIPGAVARLGSGNELAGSHRQALRQVLERARRTTAQDFLAGRPDVVIVDAREPKPYFGGVAFDYVAFFSEDPGFRAAWQHYQRVATEAGFEIWRRNHSEDPHR